jgi:hypothetical protein
VKPAISFDWWHRQPGSSIGTARLVLAP